MYNLLVFYNEDWTSGRVTVPAARVFEHTEQHIQAAFQNGGVIALDQLRRLPCLFMSEGTDDEVAYVGTIVQARLSGRDIVVEYLLDRDVPPLRNSVIHANRLELGIGDWEFSRNHWAVKEVDLYRVLLRTVRPRRQRPTVFRLEEHEDIDPMLVSAMMPFDPGFAAIYQSIQTAAANVGLRCQRADDIWEAPEIIQDIVSLIDRSRIVVCDCTGRNPNVFYEAGIAHTLGREVILITQAAHDIPFDLRHLRYVQYLNNSEGRSALVEILQGRMQTILAR